MFIINQSWQKPMIRFIFLRDFIGWPGGRMVRHLIFKSEDSGFESRLGDSFFFFPKDGLMFSKEKTRTNGV